jgi:hypothetical protein
MRWPLVFGNAMLAIQRAGFVAWLRVRSVRRQMALADADSGKAHRHID